MQKFFRKSIGLNDLIRIENDRETIQEKNKRYSVNNVKCKCGCSNYVLGDKEICRYCKRYIFKSSKDEFKFRFKEQMKKKSR